MATCNTCGAEIFFALTENGQSMPLNVKPEIRMSIEEVPGQTPRCKVVKVWDTHFRTCPQAAEHRKPRDTKGKATDGKA